MENRQVDMNELLDVSEIPGFTGGDVIPTAPPLELKEVQSNPDDREKDLFSDYKEVRKNMHFQSQMLLDAAKLFLESAKSADSPRHMEVFATLMGQMTTTNKELLKMHKDMKDITEQPASNPQHINATFVSSSPMEMMEEFGSSYDVIEAEKNDDK